MNLDAGKITSAINTGGLNATETGSTDDAVLRFDAAAPTIVGPGISVATTAANGTVITITHPGWYFVEFTGVTKAATTVHLGLSSNVAAAGLNSDPSFAIAGMLEVLAPIVTPAANDTPFALRHCLEVLKGTAQVVRFHATDGSDAAPDFSTTVASFSYRVVWQFGTRGHS